MAFFAPQTFRASRSSLREAVSASLGASASSTSSATRIAFAPSAASSSVARRASPFSTSVRCWSASTDKAKAAESEVGGETMGTKANKPAAEGGSGAAEQDEVAKQLAEKDQLIKELKDKVLYGKADLQNAQRRATEEKSQASDFAITKFARDLTNSLDIINLALRSVPEPLRKAPAGEVASDDPRKALAEFYDGVDLTSKSILSMLKTHGVTQFDPTGEKFNPNEHEAMFQAPIPGKEPGTVLECSKMGFKIKDRILRAAQVGVVQG